MFELNIETDKTDALYKVGEKAVFRFRLSEADGKPAVGRQVRLAISKGAERLERTITTGAAPVELEETLDRPGFILSSAIFEEGGWKSEAQCGAGFDPLEIRQALPVPDDFKAFWDRQLDAMSRVPPNPRLRPLEPQADFKGKVECFDVKLDCPGGTPVSGYLARPVGAAPRSLPAFIRFHGAGVGSAVSQEACAAEGLLAMDINAHGIENGQPDAYYKELADGRLANYPFSVATNPEEFYFRGMYLRVTSALKFLKSQLEWDGERLVAFGSSQGGAQAVVAAGLDPHVSFCASLVPAMCDHAGILAGRDAGWPQLVKLKEGRPVDSDILRTAGYYNTACFASLVKAETFFNVGFVDTVCPPATVYAAYNNLTGPKTIENRPGMGHVYHDVEAMRRIAKHLGRA